MIEYATRSNACAYLMKPYHDEEILATIRVILSRRKKVQLAKSNIIKLKDNYLFDLEKSILTKNDKQILLTPTKCKLIECLVQNLNTTVSNSQICNHIWATDKEDSTLRSLIFRTKKTIGEELIINVIELATASTRSDYIPYKSKNI